MEGFSRKYKVIVPVICFLLLSWTLVTLTHLTGQAYGADADMGKKVYMKYCVICHGDKGDGQEADRTGCAHGPPLGES